MNSHEDKPLTLFYSITPELELDDWEQIVHSLVTYAEVVWLHAETPIAPQIPHNLRTHIRDTLGDLVAAGALSTWRLESFPSGTEHYPPPRRVIDTEEETQLYDNLNATIVQKNPHSTPFGGYFNLQSKFVEVRHELWNLGLATLCEANGVTYRRAPRHNQIVSPYYRYEQINKKYTKELFKTLQIGSLASLSATDILDIQKDASKLRAKIDSILCTKVLPFEVPDDEVIADCRKISDEYTEYVQHLVREKTGGKVLRQSGKAVVVTSVSMFLPIASLYPHFERLVSWFRGKDRNAFVLYMMELQERVKDGPSADGGTTIR